MRCASGRVFARLPENTECTHVLPLRKTPSRWYRRRSPSRRQTWSMSDRANDSKQFLFFGKPGHVSVSPYCRPLLVSIRERNDLTMAAFSNVPGFRAEYRLAGWSETRGCHDTIDLVVFSPTVVRRGLFRSVALRAWLLGVVGARVCVARTSFDFHRWRPTLAAESPMKRSRNERGTEKGKERKK